MTDLQPIHLIDEVVSLTLLAQCDKSGTASCFLNQDDFNNFLNWPSIRFPNLCAIWALILMEHKMVLRFTDLPLLECGVQDKMQNK